MTFREARQRLALHQMSIQRVGGTTELRVQFMEASYREESSAYYTDDLLDAVLTGAKMRKRKGVRLDVA